MNKSEKALVRKMLANYNTKRKTNPKMYQLADGGIQTVLPKELAWDWSNAASGAMGYGDDRRPTGIRLTKAQCQVYGGQKAALRKIFSSEQSLTQFIQSSDRQGAARVVAAKKPKKITATVANPPYTVKTLQTPANLLGEILAQALAQSGSPVVIIIPEFTRSA
jgi:hypothetical protein